MVVTYPKITGIYPTGGSVDSVTGLNTDNTDPANPIIQISVDGTSITGDGTPGNPLVSTGGGGLPALSQYQFYVGDASNLPVDAGSGLTFGQTALGVFTCAEGFNVNGTSGVAYVHEIIGSISDVASDTAILKSTASIGDFIWKQISLESGASVSGDFVGILFDLPQGSPLGPNPYSIFNGNALLPMQHNGNFTQVGSRDIDTSFEGQFLFNNFFDQEPVVIDDLTAFSQVGNRLALRVDGSNSITGGAFTGVPNFITQLIQGETKSTQSGNLESIAGSQVAMEHKGSGTITNVYGLGISMANSGSGIATNGYQLYLQPFSGTFGTKYAIFQPDATAYNSFQGRVTVSANNLILSQDSSTLRFENTGGSFTEFQVDSGQSTDINYHLPQSLGAAGTFLAQDGSGFMYWTTPTAPAPTPFTNQGGDTVNLNSGDIYSISTYSTGVRTFTLPSVGSLADGFETTIADGVNNASTFAINVNVEGSNGETFLQTGLNNITSNGGVKTYKWYQTGNMWVII